MVSIAISHIICTMALVILIILMPVYYGNVQDNITVDVAKMELKEIADYVSNTYGNTHVLVNSTDSLNSSITKRLVYLPSTVEGYVFLIRINNESTNATGITVFLKDRPDVASAAWLSPGLKVNNVPPLESGKGTVVVGCYKETQGIFMTLDYEGDQT
jgi:hypothetical protein